MGIGINSFASGTIESASDGHIYLKIINSNRTSGLSRSIDFWHWRNIIDKKHWLYLSFLGVLGTAIRNLVPNVTFYENIK
ncbi:hypothetical protein [Flavobacterium sp. SLB02]|uniref:hypothetical protein n=1 Tax=Flavobacterium sp. SLB02 TaxID=2665645 RepID=UPI0012A889EF|nr:hypothetical protein [Flavobacterium sp. SLB02]QGK73991.1 hypothetical protein GIY83_07960 [Flavobacterium sp. SLB02]